MLKFNSIQFSFIHIFFTSLCVYDLKRFFFTVKVLSPFTTDHAIYARDALAKAIYGQTFTWLVNRINESMENKVRGRTCAKGHIESGENYVVSWCLISFFFICQDPSRKTVIGLLDIYGFEVFYVNR